MPRSDAYGFVEDVPGSGFMTEGEKQEASELLQPALDALGPGTRPQDLAEFDEFLDYMGLSWDSPIFWEAFREWYGESG